jgi:hypothetical protein
VKQLLGVLAVAGVAAFAAYKAGPGWVAAVAAGCIALTAAAITVAHRKWALVGTGHRTAPVQHVRAEVVDPVRPAITGPARRPALRTTPKCWLCERCYWAWPSTAPYCSVCGGSRAAIGAGRDVTIRAIAEEGQP